MTATMHRPVTGTVKIGRWDYPAQRDGEVTLRNTKRDGTGEWVETDANFAPAEPEQSAAPDIPGFIDEDPGNPDRDDLRRAYEYIFDVFAATAYEVASQLGVSTGRAKAMITTLNGTGLTASSPSAEGKGETVVQSLRTYDEISRDQALADFERMVPADAHIRAASAHGGKVGAQHNKPGRSTWEVGTACPRGHLLEAEDIYVMANGRRQCRKCRRGYPSNNA